MADQEQPVGGAATRQSAGFTLSQLRLATSRRFGQITGTLGLELRHIALLRAVSKTDGQSQQAVAERLHILASTMAALIDHLEQQAMVERRPHPSEIAAARRRLPVAEVDAPDRPVSGPAGVHL